MITKATSEDVTQIMAIIRGVIEEMRTYNNTQWDDHYPQDEDFIRDINAGTLYVERIDEEVTGFICINEVEPEEYKELEWMSEKNCMVIHRMAVNPKYRNKGVATRMMVFSEQLATEQGIRYLKTDTYSINTKMKQLFKKFEYQLVGEMSFLGKEYPFYCYEKLCSNSYNDQIKRAQ